METKKNCSLQKECFLQDKGWSDRFIPEIKELIGKYLLQTAPVEEDMNANTDLIVLGMNSIRIACRVRRYKYLSLYRDQFTIRSGRPHGTKTELTKIIEGWGDFFFYGFCDETEKYIPKWFLGDLKIFRVWFTRELLSRKHPWKEHRNKDNSSDFISFNLFDMPKGFIVAQHDSTYSLN